MPRKKEIPQENGNKASISEKKHGKKEDRRVSTAEVPKREMCRENSNATKRTAEKTRVDARPASRVQIVNGKKNRGKISGSGSQVQKTKPPRNDSSVIANASKSISRKLQEKFSVNPSSDDDDDSDDWEAVEEVDLPLDEDDDAGPSTSAAAGITVNISSLPKKKEVDAQKSLLSQLKKRHREMVLNTHRVHLLCGLAHGFHLNDEIGRCPLLLAQALSCWDHKTLDKIFDGSSTKNVDVTKLHKLVAFVRHLFPIGGNLPFSSTDIGKCLENKYCTSHVCLTIVMLLLLRSLGLDVRLIYNLQPLPVTEAKISKAALKRATSGKSSPYFSTSHKKTGKSNVEPGAKRKRSPCDSEDEESEVVADSAKRAKARQITSPRSTSLPKATKLQKPVTRAQTKTSTISDIPESPSKKSKGSSFFQVAPLPGIIGVDYWLDVYCSSENTYIPVQCSSGQVNSYDACEVKASQPVHYVVAFGASRSAKDITPKISHNWLTVTRKLQVDRNWWDTTMRVFPILDLLRDAEEDAAIHRILTDRPLPASVQELKGHPLYVLDRDLLKYEAFYPPNPLPVGQVRGENFYLRQLVHILHTKENWLKEGRVIKPGETPYKEVKKMKRTAPAGKKQRDFNKSLLEALSNKIPQKDEMSGLYGLWQTEDFTPPVAQNGIVPRNEYGNVDLLKPSMLPIGCVHIPIKNIHKVAKKLGIDCAAAMTGWDFSVGWCHPVHDGWVVCAEFEETLLDAWNSQQFEIEREEEEKKSQRVLERWKKMIKGVLLRKQLTMKYGMAPKKPVKPEVIEVDSD